MRADARGIAETLALAAAVASLGYTAFALTRLHAFGRRLRERDERSPSATAGEHGRSADTARPPITVLKPVHGIEPGLEENLRSFCAQGYPDFHVVFGVHRADDPALDVIRRVAAEFADRPAGAGAHAETGTSDSTAEAADRVTVVVGDGVARYRNPKIANLAPMLAHARGEIVVIADSDMRVTPDYLGAVVAAFDDPYVGAVTAIYRGEPADGALASALGAMWITEQFAPSALVANAVEPLAYAFGATMAVRGGVLEAIGGLAALGDRLADDHALGRLVTEHGRTVALARYVVTNTVSEPSLRALVEHEVRWARTIRAVRPASYLGVLLTYPVPLAALYCALARRKRRALAVVAVAAALRFALHRTAHAHLGVRPARRGTQPAHHAARAPAETRRAPSAALIPLRDALGVVVWALGLLGRGVRWRDDALRMSPRGDTLAP